MPFRPSLFSMVSQRVLTSSWGLCTCSAVLESLDATAPGPTYILRAGSGGDVQCRRVYRRCSLPGEQLSILRKMLMSQVVSNEAERSFIIGDYLNSLFKGSVKRIKDINSEPATCATAARASLTLTAKDGAGKAGWAWHCAGARCIEVNCEAARNVPRGLE